MAEPTAHRVLVVDDQPAFRVAVRRLLGHTADFELVGEAEDGGAARRLTSLLHPDVVLMDIKLPDGTGIDATRHVVAAEPTAVVVLLSTYTAADLPTGASSCGARAYLHKEDLSASVLRSILAGEPTTEATSFA
jgi:DNA-binding NarL/FixJ family response regulator